MHMDMHICLFVHWSNRDSPWLSQSVWELLQMWLHYKDTVLFVEIFIVSGSKADSHTCNNLRWNAALGWSSTVLTSCGSMRVFNKITTTSQTHRTHEVSTHLTNISSNTCTSASQRVSAARARGIHSLLLFVPTFTWAFNHINDLIPFDSFLHAATPRHSGWTTQVPVGGKTTNTRGVWNRWRCEIGQMCRVNKTPFFSSPDR